jgi:hypothetical protein
MGLLVVMVLLEDKQYLEREDCDVPIFGFPCFAIGSDLRGLCQPDQRVKWRLTVSSEGLRELYEDHPSPFTIFHHHGHLRTVCSWFRGIPTIPIIWVIIEHNLIKYPNDVIWIILSEGIPWCNRSLESGRKDLKVGMMRKGLLASENVLKPINHFPALKNELIN